MTDKPESGIPEGVFKNSGDDDLPRQQVPRNFPKVQLPEGLRRALANFSATHGEMLKGWSSDTDERGGREERSLIRTLAAAERKRSIERAEAEELARLRVREEWEEGRRERERTEAQEQRSGTGVSGVLTEMKRSSVIDRLGRKYPALQSALDRPEDWAKECRIPGRRGWYYLEKVEQQCQARYGGSAPVAAVADLSAAGQLRAAGK